MSDDELAGSPYSVTWLLPDLYCSGPIEAARAAREAQLDPDNQATFYTVTDKDGAEFNVDLQFEGKDALVVVTPPDDEVVVKKSTLVEIEELLDPPYTVRLMDMYEDGPPPRISIFKKERRRLWRWKEKEVGRILTDDEKEILVSSQHTANDLKRLQKLGYTFTLVQG